MTHGLYRLMNITVIILTQHMGKHAPYPTYVTTYHFISTRHVTVALVATIKTPHYTDSIHNIYNTLHLLSHLIPFLPNLIIPRMHVVNMPSYE